MKVEPFKPSLIKCTEISKLWYKWIKGFSRISTYPAKAFHLSNPI